MCVGSDFAGNFTGPVGSLVVSPIEKGGPETPLSRWVDLAEEDDGRQAIGTSHGKECSW